MVPDVPASYARVKQALSNSTKSLKYARFTRRAPYRAESRAFQGADAAHLNGLSWMARPLVSLRSPARGRSVKVDAEEPGRAGAAGEPLPRPRFGAGGRREP